MFWIINALKILFYFILYFDSSFFSSIFFLQGVPDIIMWILSSLITSLFSYLHTAQYHSKRPFKIPIYCAYNIALYSRELKNNIYTHNPLFMLAFQCVLYILYKHGFICALKRIFFGNRKSSQLNLFLMRIISSQFYCLVFLLGKLNYKPHKIF